jgi:hypothetical protein
MLSTISLNVPGIILALPSDAANQRGNFVEKLLFDWLPRKVRQDLPRGQLVDILFKNGMKIWSVLIIRGNKNYSIHMTK